VNRSVLDIRLAEELELVWAGKENFASARWTIFAICHNFSRLANVLGLTGSPMLQGR